MTELLIGKEGKSLICIAGTSKRIGVVELESRKEVKRLIKKINQIKNLLKQIKKK